MLTRNGAVSQVTDAGEMLSQLAEGSSRRAVGSTCMNATSSRYFCLFFLPAWGRVMQRCMRLQSSAPRCRESPQTTTGSLLRIFFTEVVHFFHVNP